MGELLQGAIDVGTSIFASGAPEELLGTAAAGSEAVAQGAGDASYFLPAAGETLGEAGTALTVGANTFGGELGSGLGAGLGDFFGGMGGALTAGLGAVGTGLGNFFAPPAGAADLLPPINAPTFDNTVAPAAGQPAAAADPSTVGSNELDQLALSRQPIGAPQQFQQGGQAPAGGANPAADPLTAGQNPVPTPIDQTPQGAQQAGQGVNNPTSISPQQPQASGTAVSAAGSQQAGKSSPSFWDSAAKWAAPAVGAAGLANSIIQNKQNTVQPTGVTGAKQSAVADTAGATSAALTTQGTELASYISKGTLPPAFQTALDQATSAAKTRAISNAAASGMPTDPTKNTALAQSIQQIEQNAVVQSAELMQRLASTGKSLIDSGMSQASLQEQIYQSLINTDMQQTKNTGAAIANFASALSSKPSNTTIQLGGTGAAAQ